MQCRHWLGSVLIVCTALTAWSNAVAADEPENLALGKSYRFTCWPIKPKLGPRLPFQTKLTDGKFIKDKQFFNHPEAVVFSGAANVEVIVDLGDVYPIGEIYALHDGNQYRNFMPRREEYYVSDDGKTFYKAGQCVNTWDPPTITSNEDKKKFLGGFKKYTSGPIQAKGRYVMLRTFPTAILTSHGFRVRNHIAYDEIIVLKGDFPVAAARIDRTTATTLSAPDLPKEAFGYRYTVPVWEDLFRDGPVAMGVTPNFFIGDHEFHLSVGGVYLMIFQSMANTQKPVTGATFECTIPDWVEIVDHAEGMEIVERKTVRRDGRSCQFLRAKIDDKTLFSRYSLPHFVLAAKAQKPGLTDPLTYSYSYEVEGKRYQSSPKRVELILQPRFTAPRPKEFLQGIWFMRISRSFANHDATVKRLLAFYKTLGFQCLWGERDEAVYREGKALGFEVMSQSNYASNGYEIGNAKSMPEDVRFKQSPLSRARQGRPNLCPEFVTSDAYYPRLKDVAKHELANHDHLYGNWEPYMYQKHGCVCDRCKQAFGRFGKLTDAQLAEIWPACVTDQANELHNRFASDQIARTLAVLQRAAREAGNELGRKIKANYIPAISTSEFDPDEPRFANRGATQYVHDLDMFTIWGMPYDVRIGVINLPQMVGHNLRMVRAIDRTFAIARAAQRRDQRGRLPKVCNVSGIQFMNLGRFALPKAFYFQSVLNFAHGMDAHSSYREFGLDARFQSLRAKASRTMATHEQVVLHGQVLDVPTPAIVSPVPSLPGRDILYSRGYRRGDRRLVIVGNDYFHPIYVKLRLPGLAGDGPYWLVDRLNGAVFGGKAGFTAGALADGVLIDVPNKEFRFLEVATMLGDGTLKVVEPDSVAQHLQRDKAELAKQARYIESFVE